MRVTTSRKTFIVTKFRRHRPTICAPKKGMVNEIPYMSEDTNKNIEYHNYYRVSVSTTQ